MMIRIDSDEIVDWPTFHHAFAEAFGFPAFYGNNMDAWIDCLSDMCNAKSSMKSIHLAAVETLALVIDHAGRFKNRCPEQFSALVECAAFVNWRVLERRKFAGTPPLALAFNA